MPIRILQILNSTIILQIFIAYAENLSRTEHKVDCMRFIAEIPHPNRMCHFRLGALDFRNETSRRSLMFFY